MAIEVNAPKGGVFHPKVWAIRFSSPDKSEFMMRLVILTRNMTQDKSWDLSLQLEGKIGGPKSKGNKPLAHFFKTLPKLASRKISSERLTQVARFSDDIQRVQWELPEGFDKISFYLPDIKRFSWVPPASNRMAVISPFCSNEALQDLVKNTRSADALISRPESMRELSIDTLEHFSQYLHLDEAAETEDGEESDQSERPMSTGLHAKVYLLETRNYSDFTHIIMGSANATNAALLASKNVEILVELIGKKNKVGGIKQLLGPDGLGEYLLPFDPSKEVSIDTAWKEAEECIEKARRKIAEANLSLVCMPADQESLWSLTLKGKIPSLEGIVSSLVWPITLTSEYAVNIFESKSSSVILGSNFSALSITGLIAFELRSTHPNVSTRFVLNLPITGIPAERHSAILNSVIRNQDGFIRYLLLLLGDDTIDGGFLSSNGGSFAKWMSHLAAGEDVPLLEELTRAYSRYPDRLNEISGLVRDLSTQKTNGSVIPESFLNLWSVFEEALEGRDA